MKVFLFCFDFLLLPVLRPYALNHYIEAYNLDCNVLNNLVPSLSPDDELKILRVGVVRECDREAKH